MRIRREIYQGNKYQWIAKSDEKVALTIQNKDAAMDLAALDVARSDKRTKCAMTSPSRRIRILVKKEGQM